MVVFLCDACGTSVKKNQVAKHVTQCRSCRSVSCMDCHTVFVGDSYQAHVKCISEEQKYSGKNYVPKENKGEAKQQQWFEQVQEAIASVNLTDRRLRDLLQQLTNYPNIPRKQQKFENFLYNSLRIYDKNLAHSAWNAISQVLQKSGSAGSQNPKQNKTEAKDNEVQSSKPESNGLKACSDEMHVESKRKADSEGEERPNRKQTKLDTWLNGKISQDGESNEEATGEEPGSEILPKFKWRKELRRILKEQPEMTIKTKILRKLLKVRYAEVTGHQPESESFTVTFLRKLQGNSGAFVLTKKTTKYIGTQKL